MMEWISVSEKLPSLDEAVLSTDGDIVAVTIYKYDMNVYQWDFFSSGCGCCDTDMKVVTHWMELPQPPKPETNTQL